MLLLVLMSPSAGLAGSLSVCKAVEQDMAASHCVGCRQQTRQSLAEWKAAKEREKQQAAAEQAHLQERAKQVLRSQKRLSSKQQRCSAGHHAHFVYLLQHLS